MPPSAPYDEIADWYESVFLPTQRVDFEGHTDPLGIDRALVDLLGAGRGTCVEMGCGTGIFGDRLRQLGWDPVGVDLSTGMLRHAKGRLPIAHADVCRLPIASESVDAVLAVMVHTDLPEYPPALSEAHRVLKPGGVLVHVGVHPCFCGGFADRSDPGRIVIRSGYLDGHWTKESWTDRGVRDKVGAVHVPIAQLLNAFIDAGFYIERLTEGGAPTPVVLSARLCKPT